MIPNIFFDNDGVFIWISITGVASLIAATLSFIGVFINRKTQKDIAKQQISANLKAKARIEWIEKVRENSSNFLVHLISLQKEKANFNEKWENIEKYSELLKLYFSSKKVSEIEKEIYIQGNVIKFSHKAETILFNESLNDDKNQYVIQYIECIKKLYKNDHFSRKRKMLANSNKVYSELIREQTKLLEHTQVGFEYIKTEIDEKVKIPKVTSNIKSDESNVYDQLEKRIVAIEKNIENIKADIEGFHTVIEEFFSIISLYLKIEWDKAKNGE